MNFDEARREVLAVCLDLADRGYLPGTGGNVAYRFDDAHFAVTPSSIDYYAMKPEDICVLRLDNLARVASDRRPSIEFRLHAYVLRGRQDCRASIHTHQPIASAYSLLGRFLEIPDSASRAVLGRQVALVGYAPSGTNWLARKLRKTLRPDVNAYLLRNHGTVCCAPTLAEAAVRVEALESACAVFFRRTIDGKSGRNHGPFLAEVFTLFEE